MGDWHDQALVKFRDATDEQFFALAERHGVDQDYLLGWLDWFRTAHPEHHAKYNDMEARADALAIEGKTDAESQKEFYSLLRSMRNGAAWAAERYIEHKKQQEAIQLEQSRDPVQPALSLGR